MINILSHILNKFNTSFAKIKVIIKKSHYLFLSIMLAMFSLLLTFILVFIEHGMENLSPTHPLSHNYFIPLLLVISLPLVIIISYYSFKTIKMRILHAAGAKIRTQLTIFFLIISFISAMPQAFLSINLVRIMLNTWYNRDTNRTLSQALHLAESYYAEKKSALKMISESSIKWPETRTDAQKLLEENPTISAMQLYNRDITYFYGDDILKIPNTTLDDTSDGYLPERQIGDLTILSYKVKTIYQDVPSIIVYSSVLADYFGDTAKRLTQHEAAAQLYQRFAFFLKAGMALFYLLFSLPLMLFAIFAGLLMADDLVDPIVKLEKATREVSKGNYDNRITVDESSELADLMHSFNTMVSKMQVAKEQEAKLEQLKAWGEIAQRLAHEIKNPLTPIKLSAQRLQKKCDEGNLDIIPIKEASKAIIEQTDALVSMVDKFRSLSQHTPAKKELFNIKTEIDNVCHLFSYAYDKISIICLANDDLKVFLDKAMMGQVLLNLIKNAIESIEESGTITIDSYITENSKDKEKTFIFKIKDTGKGFNTEDKNKLFVPYFTNKKNGSGLGLSIVQKIIAEHGGFITAHSDGNGLGSLFTIEIPFT